MRPQVVKQEIERAISQLTAEQLREVLKFIRRLNKSTISSKARSKFWELAGAGDSGLKDVGSRKHKYLAKAYEKDG